MARLENLLGAHSLALADRLLAGDEPAGTGASSSESAALVTLLAHPGRTVGWLGGVLGLTTSGVTRLVERLVSAGLVDRNTGRDARSRQLELSPAGAARAESILAGRRATLSRAVAALSPSERVALESMLAKMVGGVTDDEFAALHVCRLCDRPACRDRGRACPLQHTVPAGQASDA